MVGGVRTELTTERRCPDARRVRAEQGVDDRRRDDQRVGGDEDADDDQDAAEHRNCPVWE